MSESHRMPPQGPLRWAYRFTLGRHLDGRPRGNGDFWRKSKEPVAPFHRLYPWSRLPGWKRAAWRFGVATGACVTGQAYAAHPVATRDTVATGALVALSYGARRGAVAWRDRRHRRGVIKPLARALAPRLGVSPDTWRDFLAVPRQYADGAPVVVALSQDTADNMAFRTALERTVSGRLGLVDMRADWDMTGEVPTVTFRGAPRPPDRVTLADVRELLDAQPDGSILLGLGSRRTPVTFSLDSDSPHVAIAARTGGGKSVLAQFLCAQVLRRGGNVTIIDIKGSHRWAKDTPGVTYIRKIVDIHDALELHGELAVKRNDRAWASPDDDYDVGPRELILIEELNRTMARLMAYWQGIRSERDGDPKVSPAIDGYNDVLSMGRSARYHVVALAQSFTSRASGGPEARENYGLRALARPTTNAWKMLVPEAGKIPKVPRVPGRWFFVINGDVTPTQVPLMSVAEARELAGLMSKDVLGRSSSVTLDKGVRTPSEPRTSERERHLHVVPRAPAPDDQLSLREAVDEKILPWSLDAARKRRDRDPDAPKPVTQRGQNFLYRRDDLIRWADRSDRESAG